MEARTRRALLRLIGAAVIVLGVFVTATAVRRNDQVVASGRDVLLAGERVDLFSAQDLTVTGHAKLAGTAIALGDLEVESGTLRVERDASRVFAVGGAVTVAETASVIFPETGSLKYGTIRSGDVGGHETVLRDADTVAVYAEMVPALRASSECFARAPSTGFVRSGEEGLTLVGDGVSGLQIFNVDRTLTGDIIVSRIPRHATVLVNVIGSSVELAPVGRGWDAIAASTVVNVPAAANVTVATGEGTRLNTLVGAEDGEVALTGTALTGTLLSLSPVEIGDTRVDHGPVLASLLPECGVEYEDPPDETVPAVTVPGSAETTESSSSTTTTTTTTTTVAGGFQPRGERPVPGAAFALGGAASTGHWWIGVPLSLVGAVILGSGWLEACRREREERMRRRQITLEILQRGEPRDGA